MFLILLLSVFLATVPNAQAKEAAPLLKHAESRVTLGTIVTVDVCYERNREEDLKKTLVSVWARLGEINQRMNPYDEKSDISFLNNAEGNPVQVHDDVYFLLAAAQGQNQRTAGVFDVTVGPLIALWKKSAREGVMPAREELLSVRSRVNSGHILLGTDFEVRLLPGTVVDLSGSAQGYAADEVAAILRQQEFSRFMVDTGGEIRVAGPSCDGRSFWRIGVKDPFDAERLKEILEVTDVGVSTSGNYEKHFEIAGETWSHIINPVTGYPSRGIAGATVVAPTAMEADVWSTALCVLGAERGFPLLRNQGEGYAAVVYSVGPDGARVRSAMPEYERIISTR